MDLNTTKVNNNQENQLLLNAIRNKFDTQRATEPTDFSSPILNIPLLKIPESTRSTVGNANSNKNIQPNEPTTQLNQFLLQQLQEKCANNDLTKARTEFVLPQLQSNDKKTIKFDLPMLRPQSTNTNIVSLTAAITKLQIQEYARDDEALSKHSDSATIDLTSALATKLQTHQGTPPTRDLIKPEQSDKLDFEIPFIDCDRMDVSRLNRIILPTSNEYCVTDISQLSLHHSLTKPSAVGRFLSICDNKYLPPLPLKSVLPEHRQQKVKHNIEPFGFETKSPDDLVLQALSKYQRRHYS